VHWRRFRVAKGGQRVVMVAEDERRREGRGTNCCFPSRESCHVELLPESAGFSRVSKQDLSLFTIREGYRFLIFHGNFPQDVPRLKQSPIPGF